MAHLVVEHVGKVFSGGRGPGVAALRETNLEVQEGELVSLVGPSGCGKSTLLRLVAGLDTPTTGTLTLDGAAIRGPDRRRSLVFQDPNLFPWLTVRENVRFGLKLRSGRAQNLADADAMVNLVGLQGFEGHYPHQLSGGMAQRTALARTLVTAPELVLLDEPLGALDSFTRMQMQDEILRLRAASGAAMIMVTHDVDEAIYMSDRIAIFSGRPGTIERILPVGLPQRRNRNDPDFLRLRGEILELFHFAQRPEPNQEVVI